MFTKQTIKDVDLTDKRVLVRVDWNVPGTESGQIEDDFRIRASLPTLKYLRDHGASKIIIISHRGRPEGIVTQKDSLKPAQPIAEALLSEKVRFAEDARGDIARHAIESTERFVLLENLRFHAEEEANDEAFAKELASYADIFVQDGFAVVHHPAASVTEIPKLLPAFAGLLVEKEVKTILSAMLQPQRPLLAIIGGAKIEGKIELIDEFIEKADNVVIGGAMANTFIQDEHFGGFDVAKSLYDSGEAEQIQRIYDDLQKNNKQLLLPTIDVAVGTSIEDTERKEKLTTDVWGDDVILDLGQKSIAEIEAAIDQAKTIIWNGPIGYFENPAFMEGSKRIAKAIARSDAFSVIGGGDTADLIDHLGIATDFDHVSTGGGASLELMAGKQLPGVEALQNA